MNLSKRIAPEYATALKDAILMRRLGTIDAATDTALGHICNSISEWAAAEQVIKGKLWRTFSQDEDFMGYVRLKVVGALDKVALDKAPRQMLVYLKNCGINAINHFIRDANRLKRRHTDVDIFDSDAKADFYGRHLKEFNNNHQSEEEQNEQLCRPDREGSAGTSCGNRNQTGGNLRTGTGTACGTVQSRRIAAAKRRVAEARAVGLYRPGTDPSLESVRRRAAAAFARHPQDGERLFLL